jgi:hypothetical protein
MDADASYAITSWALRVDYTKDSSFVRRWIFPLAAIASVDKKGGKKRGSKGYGLVVTLSTCAKVKIGFSKKSDLRPRFYKKLLEVVNEPLTFEPRKWIDPTLWLNRIKESSGWTAIDNDFCATYPPKLLMPPGLPIKTIHECAEFRTRQRLPFLSFIFPLTGAPLLRSSQPKTGFIGSSSPADDELVRAVRQGRSLAILDCRPKLNAVVNQFTGGGYESISKYENATFTFLGIPNIHRVREAFIAMTRNLRHSRTDPAKDWGALVIQILKGAQLAVDCLKHNEATLVHCTDGWDRTAQIAGLVQILVDPSFRTISGFRELIQKEWCDGGHKFALRCSHIPHEHMSESAPIFAQFIDCVFQIVDVHPNSFEFGENLLAYVLFHAYSQLFGDFYGNSWKERTVSMRGPSIWATLSDANFGNQFINRNYVRFDGEIDGNLSKYKFSELICGGPLFGCDARVPMMSRAPRMDCDVEFDEYENFVPMSLSVDLDEADDYLEGPEYLANDEDGFV